MVGSRKEDGTTVTFVEWDLLLRVPFISSIEFRREVIQVAFSSGESHWTG